MSDERVKLRKCLAALTVEGAGDLFEQQGFYLVVVLELRALAGDIQKDERLRVGLGGVDHRGHYLRQRRALVAFGVYLLKHVQRGCPALLAVGELLIIAENLAQALGKLLAALFSRVDALQRFLVGDPVRQRVLE